MSAEAVWRSALARTRAAGGGTRVQEPGAAYALKVHEGWLEAASSQSEPLVDNVSACGKDNVVMGGFMSARPTGCRIRIKGDRNVVFFGPRTRLAGLDVLIEADDCLVYFGALTSSGRMNVSIRQSGQAVVVGDRCMCSHTIFLGEPDPVKLYSTVDGAPLSPLGDILVDDHVWIGRDVRMKPGARVAADTVVGQSATIEGQFPPNVILAGSPARPLRSDVTWGRSAEATLDELEASKAYKGHIVRQLDIIRAHIALLDTQTGQKHPR